MTTGAQLLSQPEDRANVIYTEALFRMFGLVALGVMVTAVSIWVGDALVVGKIIFGNGWVGFLLYLGAVFGTLIASSVVANRGMLGLATVLYLGFATLEGFFISPILELATGESMATAFVLVAALFIVMAAIGLRTKRDLSGLGSMLFFMLLGAVAVIFLNLFLFQSGSLADHQQHHPIPRVPRSDNLGDKAHEGPSAGSSTRRGRGQREQGGRSGRDWVVPECSEPILDRL